VLRSTLAAVVGRGCETWGRVSIEGLEEDRLFKRNQGKNYFFMRVPFVSSMCCCGHIRGGRMGILHLLALRGWMRGSAACCPAEEEEACVYLSGWKALSGSCEEFPSHRLRGKGRGVRTT